MRVRLAIPEHELDDQEKKDALDAALEAVTRTNVPLVRNRRVPLAAAAIKAGLVKWHPEPPGDEHFDLPTTVLARKWGDCDDLAPWHAASLRAAGNDPGARAIVKKSGPNRWHAVVQRSDGSIDDPSRAAGMGSRGSGSSVVGGMELVGAAPSITTPMHDARLAIAIYPHRSAGRHGWIARVDIPDSADPWHWSGLFKSPNVHGACVGAIQTARNVAEEGNIDPDDECRLGALEDLLAGMEPQEVAAAVGEFSSDPEAVMEDAMVVGSFFDHIAHALKKIARPFASIASKAVQFIPGVGPIASTAIDMAAKLLPRDHPAHPANAHHPQHAAAVHQLIQQGHPAYAGAFEHAQPAGEHLITPQDCMRTIAPFMPYTGNLLAHVLDPASGLPPPPNPFTLPPGMPTQPFPGGPAFLRF